MTADDTYTVQFETADGATGLLHSSCATGGQFVVTTKITGTDGSAWMQGDEVWIDTGAGPHPVPAADDLPVVAPVPPPGELLHTTYDMWHSIGMDLAPYTRLYEVMRDRILGSTSPRIPRRARSPTAWPTRPSSTRSGSRRRGRSWTEVGVGTGGEVFRHSTAIPEVKPAALNADIPRMDDGGRRPRYPERRQGPVPWSIAACLHLPQRTGRPHV